MKSLTSIVSVLAALAALHTATVAQPTTPAPVPTPQTPAPTDPQGQGSGSNTPSWLQGVDEVTGPEQTPTAMTLTLDKAVEIALKQQPTVREAAASVEAAESRIDAARVAHRPMLSAGASASAGSKDKFFSITEGTGLNAQASWRIYDFGQTAAAIRAAEANAAAAHAAVGTNLLDVRTNVEVAYLEAVARQRLVKVAQATVKSEDAHLDQAKRFVAAQAKDPIEVAQAQARDANAKSALAQAQSNEAIALANLRSAIGWLDPSRSPVVDPNWPMPPDQQPPSLVPLVDAARKHRPEIVQLDAQIAAAEASVTAAHAERRPVISANAVAQWNPSEEDWRPHAAWQATIGISIPILDGGRSRADVRQANANLISVNAQRDALLVSLTSQLDLARSQIIANQANTQASNEAVTAARAQLQLAEARYAQGLGSQIELADAQTAVTTAEGNLVSAQWQLADAWAQLRRAIGSSATPEQASAASPVNATGAGGSK